MEKQIPKIKQSIFHRLKIAKKEKVTKNCFILEFHIPNDLKTQFHFESGQYVALKYFSAGKDVQNDYSITSAPYEEKITLAIKINSDQSSTLDLFNNYNIGDELEVSEPNGRFTIASKPNEFRTILGFAAGIGITPIFSHIKNILHNEKRTRFFLFYGSKSSKNIIFKTEMDNLSIEFENRFFPYYFHSEEGNNQFFRGRLDDKKLELIINQILHLDNTDEESTIWDSVDEVLICGKGEMIKTLANSCLEKGIQKKNIHFELFAEYNEDIFPVDKNFPLIEDITVEFQLYNENFKVQLKDNKYKLLQQLLDLGYPLPYSCKSGICGSCECILEEGKVDLLENEYLTENEEKSGKILPCQSIVLSKNLKLNFDLI